MIDRLDTYSRAASILSGLSDSQLAKLLAGSEKLHAGIGGRSTLVQVDQIPVFVKRVPLSNLELDPTKALNTTNLFDLPLCCHYGIGSPGFSAWREVMAQIITTNWVTSGQCANFPILYHWRVLPASAPQSISLDEWGSLQNFVKFWDNSEAVARRVEAINSARHEVVMFLEYIPGTLYDWLHLHMSAGQNLEDTSGAPATPAAPAALASAASTAFASARGALEFAADLLDKTNMFMLDRGFIHFDAHFKNILTDGTRIYLSDFGLALSSQFDLTATEQEFLHSHQSFDRCASSLHLVHCILTSISKSADWRLSLKNFLNGDKKDTPAPIAKLLDRYANTAEAMDEFLATLQKISKATPYPSEKMESLLRERPGPV